MSIDNLKVLKNINHNDEIFELIVENKNHPIKAGQFYGLKLNDKTKILRRPISVNKCDDKQISFLIKNTGGGVSEFLDLKEGDLLNVMGPLGNGFDISEIKENSSIILYGGGIGVAPLLQLGIDIKSTYNDVNIITILGYRENPYQVEDFKAISKSVDVFVELESSKENEVEGVLYTYGKYPSEFLKTVLENNQIDYIYSCGPEPLLKNAVDIFRGKGNTNSKIYVSLEERMACGIGACLCCTKVINENQGICVCKDGPVFDGMEVY